MAQQARSTLAEFDIQEAIGSGSFGCVYRARRHADGQLYALKAVDLSAMSAREQEDCIKETQLLASLDCPYIIKFYDSFLHKGKLFICMEFAPGGNLYDHIQRAPGRLPEQQIWRLFIQMLLGLAHMHARKVLHRDIKSPNVFLDADGNVRLGDLGVAKMLSADTMFAQTMIGTPYYMSPEMCEDRPYDEKSDVWSLGVVLYECCTQRHPFSADNQGALMLKILRGRYPPISTSYSPSLDDVLKACLTQDASKRPDTGDLLAMRAVRERAACLGLELPPLPEAACAGRGLLAASPSRRGLAAGRSFTSMRSHAATPAGGGEQQAAPAPAQAQVLTPAVVLLQPSLLPPAPVSGSSSSSRSPTPPVGRSPSVRAGSRRALLSPREQQGGAEAPVAAAGLGGGAGSLEALGVAAVAAGRPASAGAKKPLAAGGGAAGPAAGESAADSGAPLDTHLQALRVSAAAAPGAAAAAGAAADAAAGAAAGAASGDRCQALQQALRSVRKQIITQVGPLAADALREVFLAAAQAGDAPGQQSGGQLAAAVAGVAPAAHAAAVVPLLVRLLYLEQQLEEPA